MCAVAMQAAQGRLNDATTELANAETDGFTRHVAGAASLGTTPASLRATGNPLDLSVTGRGGLRVAARSAGGGIAHAVATLRSASFARDPAGFLVDGQGRLLLGAHGPLHVPRGSEFRSDGTVVANGVSVGTLPLGRGATLHSGFRIGSNVNSIAEMVEILDAQRSFETAQKTLSSVDAARQKATTDVGHIQ